ncbi:ASCH domain-containing protein [Microbacterium sp.]|uniref:ASCH domain-containing protein n=1 Tax=Microbacterium sp. TaxID=51671 RepID=UPI0039E325E5
MDKTSPSTTGVIAEFWHGARAVVPTLPETPPGSDRIWGLGATPEQADRLLLLVLAGTKTATAGYLEEYEAEGAAVEQIGDLDILLDGAGAPRAIIETTSVDIRPFDEVTAEHAFAEGEDDRTLASWRRIHRDFYERFVAPECAFRNDMPIVCQRFRLVYPRNFA